MKKKSTLGRAPPRSKRGRLLDKGYSELYNLNTSLTEARAKKMVQDLHAKGLLAQAVFVNPFGEGGHWTVMYRGK